MNSRTSMVLLSVVVVVSLLTASFVVWLYRAVYNSRNFSRTTVSVIQRPAVRDALSAEIVQNVLKELPKDIEVPKSAVRGPAQSLVSALLASPTFRPLLENLADELNKAVTASRPTAIKLDTTDIKAAAGPLVDTLNTRLNTNIQISDMPDSIVLIKKGAIPSIYGPSIALLWLGPILGVIGAVIIVAMFLSAARENRPVVLRTLGWTLAIGSVLFIALVSLMRSPLVASIDDANARIIAGNMFGSFTSSLAAQTWVLAGIGLVMAVAGYVWPRLAKPAPATRAPQKKKAA